MMQMETCSCRGPRPELLLIRLSPRHASVSVPVGYAACAVDRAASASEVPTTESQNSMNYWEFRGNTVHASDLSDAVFLAHSRAWIIATAAAVLAQRASVIPFRLASRHCRDRRPRTGSQPPSGTHPSGPADANSVVLKRPPSLRRSTTVPSLSVQAAASRGLVAS
jgi:hypothetical protein